MAKVVIVGPAHPLRGGLATFDQRLAKEFTNAGHDCSIYSFSLQYPSFLFPGKTQFSEDPAPENLKIYSVINSINPFNWIRIGNRLKREKPDLIIVRYWLPFMGPCLGTILRRAKKHRKTRVICIADNVIPHEKRPADRTFTRYFLKSCDGFITMSEKVMSDLRKFQPSKPAKQAAHPLYDNFGEIVPKREAREKLVLPPEGKLILFFGFIRNYKGLDILLRAMAQLDDVRLVVAGEFYEDRKPYDQLIEQLGIGDRLVLRTDFIPDSEVKYYLCATDVVIQPYRNATQSGVTPLAYHFEKPMVVTNVGGLPSLVPDGKVGIVVESNPGAIADGIRKFYSLGESHFIPNIREEKKKYTWGALVSTIEELAQANDLTINNKQQTVNP
jgi:glycosyltransferase involved in cell wall biosynthesis